LFLFAGFIDRRLGRSITPNQPLDDRLVGAAGRGLIANIDVAIAHDGHPLLEVRHNAQRA
jgi:hypothetical protein